MASLKSTQLFRDSQVEVLKRLSYPIIILNSKIMPIWANNKFLALHQMKMESLGGNHELQEALIQSLTIHQYEINELNKHWIFQPVRSDIRLNGKKMSLISLFDISKQKKQQVKLLAKQAMFEPLSEMLPEGIVLTEDKICYTNPLFEKLIGYSGKMLRLKKLEDLIIPTDQELYKENIKKLHSHRRTHTKSVLKLISSKNKNIWVRIKTSLLKRGDNILYLNVINDISHEQDEMNKLNLLANFDALTGIYNRHKFNELCNIEYKQAKRYKHPLGGIFLDIDHFKSINDNYGHDIGDKVLKNLAILVRSCIRETDIFARWGGEEFCIVLPETNIENSLVMAEKIRESVCVYTFPIVNHITVSIGVTELIGNEHLDSFLKRMDKALYLGKENGRNCSVTL